MSTDNEAARDLLARTRALLLDFDGPVCSVFAGIPADSVAEQLRVVLADGGHTDLPDEVATATDPFDVFRYAATLGDDEARYVEAAFTAHELEAITTAEPTPGAHDLMCAWHESGRPLAIVSNNSARAINAYLDFHGLRQCVNHVSARESADASLLKPNPRPVNQVISTLGAERAECVLVGDSTVDVEAAQAAGIRVVGYANKPGKDIKMASEKVDAITPVMIGLIHPIAY